MFRRLESETDELDEPEANPVGEQHSREQAYHGLKIRFDLNHYDRRLSIMRLQSPNRQR